MRILFWIPYPSEGASNRYRVEQYLPYLKKAGIKYSVRSFWGISAYRILYRKGRSFAKCCYFIVGTMSRLFDVITIFRYRFIFIHRESFPVGGVFFETILAALRKPFIFDFDDAIFLSSSSISNNFIEKYKRPAKVINIIKMSRHVIAGNSYLADFATRFNNAVSVIPTSIDTDKYHPVEKKDSDEVIIGWIGSGTTLKFLNVMEDTFVRLSKCFPYVKFKITGGDFYIGGLSNVVSKPWSFEEELEDLSSFDIGIMPMPDDEWTRGKCGFKAILYMSMGIPCVCSPVGVNKEIVTDGMNGFLPSNEEEWFEDLSRLVQSRQLRKMIGLAGRKKIEDKYSLAVNAEKYLNILKEASG